MGVPSSKPAEIVWQPTLEDLNFLTTPQHKKNVDKVNEGLGVASKIIVAVVEKVVNHVPYTEVIADAFGIFDDDRVTPQDLKLATDDVKEAIKSSELKTALSHYNAGMFALYNASNNEGLYRHEYLVEASSSVTLAMYALDARLHGDAREGNYSDETCQFFVAYAKVAPTSILVQGLQKYEDPEKQRLLLKGMMEKIRGNFAAFKSTYLKYRRSKVSLATTYTEDYPWYWIGLHDEISGGYWHSSDIRSKDQYVAPGYGRMPSGNWLPGESEAEKQKKFQRVLDRYMVVIDRDATMLLPDVSAD